MRDSTEAHNKEHERALADCEAFIKSGGKIKTDCKPGKLIKGSMNPKTPRKK